MSGLGSRLTAAGVLTTLVSGLALGSGATEGGAAENGEPCSLAAWTAWAVDLGEEFPAGALLGGELGPELERRLSAAGVDPASFRRTAARARKLAVAADDPDLIDGALRRAGLPDELSRLGAVRPSAAAFATSTDDAEIVAAADTARRLCRRLSVPPGRRSH